MPTSSEAMFAGARGRCMACGEGKLFEKYLKLAEKCPACGTDFSMADIGDGAAVLVILLTGAFVVPVALAFQFRLGWPPLGGAALGIVLTLLVCLFLLPIVKGVLFTMQWTHKAGEGRSE